MRQLLAQGLLAVHGDGYGTLVITEASAEVLTGGRVVRLRREVARPTRSSKRSAPSDLPAGAAPLFERLRAWRGATARALNPGIETVVRTHNEEEAVLLAREAAGKIFFGEEELAKGMSRHVLERYGITHD